MALGCCWLQDEACQVSVGRGIGGGLPSEAAVLRVLEGFGGFGAFKGWQTAGLDAQKKPWMCGLGVPVGCRMKHANVWPWGACWLQDEACQGFQRLEGLRAQSRLGRPEEAIGFKLFRGLERLEGLRAGKRQAWTPIRSHGCVALERLRAGKRQAWTPIRSHGCVALGCLLAAG